MRVVVDTNVIVSRSISNKGASALIFDLWLQGEFDLIVSEDILSEYRRALGYERTRKRHGYTPSQIDQFVMDIRNAATVVMAGEPLKVVQDDTDDNKFIECAIAGDG